MQCSEQEEYVARFIAASWRQVQANDGRLAEWACEQFSERHCDDVRCDRWHPVIDARYQRIIHRSYRFMKKDVPATYQLAG